MKPTDVVVRRADDLLTTKVDGDLIGMSNSHVRVATALKP